MNKRMKLKIGWYFYKLWDLIKLIIFGFFVMIIVSKKCCIVCIFMIYELMNLELCIKGVVMYI